MHLKTSSKNGRGFFSVTSKIMDFLKLFLIISVLLITSCNEVSKQDIQGKWIYLPYENENSLLGVNINEDKIELIGEDYFNTEGKYDLKNGKIHIKNDRDNKIMNTRIRMIGDTLLFNNDKYVRNKDSFSDINAYKLIGIPTNTLISDENSFYELLHLYKSNNQLQLRYQDRIISFEELPLCLYSHHSNHTIILYLGEGITLDDLKKMYYHLAALGKSNIWLGTKKEGLFDTHIIEDKIEIWGDDLMQYLKELDYSFPPPPPPQFTSKQEYLKNGGKELIIHNKTDLKKIKELGNEKHVISISSNLSIEDYLKIKRMIREQRKSNKKIMTEIQ